LRSGQAINAEVLVRLHAIGGTWRVATSGAPNEALLWKGMDGELRWRNGFRWPIGTGIDGVSDENVRGSIAVSDLSIGGRPVSAVQARIDIDRAVGHLDVSRFRAFGGSGTANLTWNRLHPSSAAELAVRLSEVDATAFLGCMFPIEPGAIRGKASANLALRYSGSGTLFPQGDGDLRLTRITVAGLRRGAAVLEELRRVPVLGAGIDRARWSSPFDEVSAGVHLDGPRVVLSHVLFRHPLFDARSSNLSIGPDNRLQAQLRWFPKPRLVGWNSLPRDEEGHFSLPLVLEGTVSAPKIRTDLRGLRRFDLEARPVAIETEAPPPPAPVRAIASRATHPVPKASPTVSPERRAKGPPE
jgi:hypothetical protein